MEVHMNFIYDYHLQMPIIILLIIVGLFIFIKVKKAIHRIIGMVLGIYSVIRLILLMKGFN